MQQEPILKVEDLAVRFKTYRGIIRAVRNVDFEVAKGEALGIVGESGCGKSVTAHAVMRLLPEENSYIEHGTITMEGKNLLDMDEKEMHSIIKGNIETFQMRSTLLLQIVQILEHQYIEPYIQNHLQ